MNVVQQQLAPDVGRDRIMLTSYQDKIVKWLEAEYRLPFDKVVQLMRKRGNRCSDMAEFVGCSRSTFRLICKEYGIDFSHTKMIVNRPSTFPNATDFFRRFDTVEDAVVECRDRLELSVEDTAEKLGIGRSTVVRYTPEYLKWTFNKSKKKKRKSSPAPPSSHPWRGRYATL